MVMMVVEEGYDAWEMYQDPLYGQDHRHVRLRFRKRKKEDKGLWDRTAVCFWKRLTRMIERLVYGSQVPAMV